MQIDQGWVPFSGSVNNTRKYSIELVQTMTGQRRTKMPCNAEDPNGNLFSGAGAERDAPGIFREKVKNQRRPGALLAAQSTYNFEVLGEPVALQNLQNAKIC